MRIAIHYFSATGNTARAVEVIRGACAGQGHDVALHPIEHGAVPPAGGADLVVLAFPTIAFGLPTLIAGYLKRLPRSDGGKAAVFATFAGHPFLSLAQGAAFLRRRGYDVFLTGGAAYPNNWVQTASPPAPAAAEESTAAGDRGAAAFAGKLLSGRPELYRCSFGAAALSVAIAFLFRLIGRRFMGKTFVADERCNGCGYCARICPTGTISLPGQAKPRPRWGFTCADCCRCINLCPAGAIQTSVLRLVLHGIFHVAALAGLITAAAPLDRAVGGVLGAPWRYVADGILILGLLALAFWLQFGPLDRLMYELEKSSLLGPRFSSSFTRGYRRYRAPGFKI